LNRRVLLTTRGAGSRLLPLLLIALLVTLSAASFKSRPQTASASVQRVVLAELFTATWCGYCPYATRAINQLSNEYGSTRLLVLQYHPNDTDVFGTTESAARINYYAIPGYPTTIFDGTNQEIGGYNGTYDAYKAKIDSELPKPTEVSISLTGSLTDFTADVSASNSMATTSAKVRFVVYEDNIPYSASNGENLFRFTVRRVLSEQAVTLTPGKTVSVRRTFLPQAAWNSSNLGLVVFVQKDDTREVLQAATLSKQPAYFSLTISGTAKTVQANETANFSAVLANNGASDDSYNVTLTKSLPAGWVAGFCTGSTCYWESAIISVKSGLSQNISIYIVSSGSTGTGKATLSAVSQSDAAIAHSVTTPDVTLSSTSPSPTVPEMTPLATIIALAVVSCTAALAAKRKKLSSVSAFPRTKDISFL